MRIQITDDVRIECDETSWTISTRRVTQKGTHKGRERWEVLGYYPTLKAAASRLLDARTELLLDDLRCLGIAELVAQIELAAEHLHEVTAGELMREVDRLRLQVSALSAELGGAREAIGMLERARE